MWMICLSSGHMAKTNWTNTSTASIHKLSSPWRGKKTTGSASWMLPWQERMELKSTENPHTHTWTHTTPPNTTPVWRQEQYDAWAWEQRRFVMEKTERTETPKRYLQMQWIPEGSLCTKPEEIDTYNTRGRGNIQHRQAQTAVSNLPESSGIAKGGPGRA